MNAECSFSDNAQTATNPVRNQRQNSDSLNALHQMKQKIRSFAAQRYAL
jgi:hypothetical protein